MDAFMLSPVIYAKFSCYNNILGPLVERERVPCVDALIPHLLLLPLAGHSIQLVCRDSVEEQASPRGTNPKSILYLGLRSLSLIKAHREKPGCQLGRSC